MSHYIRIATVPQRLNFFGQKKKFQTNYSLKQKRKMNEIKQNTNTYHAEKPISQLKNVVVELSSECVMWVKSIASKNWLKQQKLRARHPWVCVRDANSIHRSQLNWYRNIFQFKECSSLTTCASISTIWRKRALISIWLYGFYVQNENRRNKTLESLECARNVSLFIRTESVSVLFLHCCECELLGVYKILHLVVNIDH